MKHYNNTSGDDLDLKSELPPQPPKQTFPDSDQEGAE